MSSLSIVIPTRNRAAVLSRTLSALNAQEIGDAKVEVVVVDNGSRDDTVEQVKTRSSAIPIHLLEHPDGGPAAARNAAVEVAVGDLLLFLGDDTEPEGTELLQRHLALHRAKPMETYGVLGRITWSPRHPVTPFMRWLENGGPQFAYNEISAGLADPVKYFYSSHVSIKRSLFERAGGFDERFPSAAVEDTEFGVRLADAGLEMDYHPELLVLHDHPTTPRQSLQRSIVVGRSAALYNVLRPERPHSEIAPPSGLAWTGLRVLRPLIDLLAKLPLATLLQQQLWLAMHRARYAQGYRMGSPAGE